MISIIVARDLNYAIGKNNNLIYHIKEDMKRFKELTTNHIVIMGRKTKDSLPKGYLPNRTNIILTNNATKRQFPILDDTINMDGYISYCSNIDTLINTYENSKEEVFVIGGDSIYKQFLPYANKIYLTEIRSSCQEADTFFKFNELNYDIDKYDTYVTNEGLKYSFIDYIKKQ